MRRRRVAALVLATSGTFACTTRPPATVPGASPALAALSLAGAATTIDSIAPGLVHYRFVVAARPWAIHVLDADRQQCWTPVAAKGAVGAVGRTTTSAIASALARTTRVGGAVNADFFLFTPPGLPTGAHVEDGAVVTGPGARPVFAVDGAGRAWLGVLSDTGEVRSGSARTAIAAWNRASPMGVAWFDARFGTAMDTATGSLRVVIDGASGGRVTAIDSSGGATHIPPGGGVLTVSRSAPAAVRRQLEAMARGGGRIDVTVSLGPIHPRHAVGGFPILVRDSQEVAGIDSAGSATFGPVRHPRTIVGVAANGRRLLLVVVDGRQAGYSAGMTLRESAQLLRDLGATEAINLDGGGSTAMVVRRDSSGVTRYQPVNRPSDPAGERPVGNALALVCR